MFSPSKKGLDMNPICFFAALLILSYKNFEFSVKDSTELACLKTTRAKYKVLLAFFFDAFGLNIPICVYLIYPACEKVRITKLSCIG